MSEGIVSQGMAFLVCAGRFPELVLALKFSFKKFSENGSKGLEQSLRLDILLASLVGRDVEPAKRSTGSGKLERHSGSIATATAARLRRPQRLGREGESGSGVEDEK